MKQSCNLGFFLGNFLLVIATPFIVATTTLVVPILLASPCMSFVRGASVRRSLTGFFVSTQKTNRPLIRSSPIQFMSSTGFPEVLPSIPLLDGREHPAMGFGTYKVGFIPASASSAVAAAGATDEAPQRTAEECVYDALQVGYRFLECAEFYGNEAQVGKAIQRAIQDGILKDRSDLFLVSKVWTTTIEQGEQAIRDQLMKTLQDLQTDYLDLYLIHWPVPSHHVAAYKTLQVLKEEGHVKGIGVSNYAWEDYVELKESSLTTPLVNQIEINPFLYRKNTLGKFKEEGVVLQSYRSLRDGKAMDHPVLVEMAQKHSRSVAQILGRWCVQHGFVYVPKSVKKDRMLENAQVFDFELSKEEMEELDNLTTPENLQTFQALYRKCVNRDTSKDGSLDGVKMDITID